MSTDRVMIDPKQPPAYGISFEGATTSIHDTLQPVEGTKGPTYMPTAYHRVAQYDIGDLRFLVRYEVDAMWDGPLQSVNADVLANNPQTPQGLEEMEVENQGHSMLRHIIGGTLVSQDRIMELKSTKQTLKW